MAMAIVARRLRPLDVLKPKIRGGYSGSCWVVGTHLALLLLLFPGLLTGHKI